MEDVDGAALRAIHFPRLGPRKPAADNRLWWPQSRRWRYRLGPPNGRQISIQTGNHLMAAYCVRPAEPQRARVAVICTRWVEIGRPE